MNVLSLFVQWYILMGMYHEQDPDPWKHSHKKYRDELEYLYRNYTKQLAMVIRQSTLEDAFWESRYCSTECSHKYSKSVYQNVRNYSSQGLIHSLLEIFSYEWEEDIGGIKWKNIVKALTIKNDVLFLDTIVDLEHNGQAILKDFCNDEFYVMSLNGFRAFDHFLEIKANESIDTIMKYYGSYVSWEVKSLFNRRCTLIGTSNNIRMDEDTVYIKTRLSTHSLKYKDVLFLTERDSDVLSLLYDEDNLGDQSIKKLFRQKPWEFKGNPVPQIIKNLNYHSDDDF